MIESSEVKRAFCFVAGRHHGPDCWQLLQEELSHEGWGSITPDLPIENELFSLDDHAKVVNRAEWTSGASEIYRVGWSWGANVIPRAIGITAVKKLIFIAGAFHPATLRRRVKGPIPSPIHSINYEVMEQSPQKGLDEMADHVFYRDIGDEKLRSALVEKLRPHPRRKIEPQLTHFPELPLEYIVLTEDQALLPDSQREFARVLGIEPVEFPSGHVPMFPKSKAKKLANLLIGLADRENLS